MTLINLESRHIYVINYFTFRVEPNCIRSTLTVPRRVHYHAEYQTRVKLGSHSRREAFCSNKSFELAKIIGKLSETSRGK